MDLDSNAERTLNFQQSGFDEGTLHIADGLDANVTYYMQVLPTRDYVYITYSGRTPYVVAAENNKADFIASYGISSQLPESDRPELSFSGRSNVGKSSLINKLCNRKNLARVSSTPGKTATINFYEVDNCYFVDLPGYGYAKVSNADRERWDDLINSYFEAPRHHTLLVQLIDCRHAPSADDLQMLKYLHYHQIPFVVALTKADKLKKSQLAKTQEDFEKICLPYGCQKVVLTSGENGYGIPELQAVLNEAVAAEFTDDEEAE